MYDTNVNPFMESAKYFPTQLQQFQFFDKYSRFDYTLGRRETWIETVDRTIDFLFEKTGPVINYDSIRQAILNLEIMPSMRLLAMAGPAAKRNNISIYNCSFAGVDSIYSFPEALYISMSGCGVGFSVEHKYINKLPNLPQELNFIDKKIYIEDSSEGWYDVILALIEHLYNGEIPEFDYSFLRPAGSVLKIKGGRASGPEVLKQSINFIINTFCEAYEKVRDNEYLPGGRFIRPHQERLSSLQVHDIICALGQCAVSGGIRRSAMISLFDQDDTEMINAKRGNYNNFRWNANNSVVWPATGITPRDLVNQMATLFNGETGEPGFFSLEAAQRKNGWKRDTSQIVGANPCGEIFLRHMQMCNLSAVVARSEDNFKSLERKIKMATILGTVQSTFTDFPKLRPEWKNNCEEERLLGVDITGQMDCPILMADKYGMVREQLKFVARDVNRTIANKLDINESAAITCCKPSGNTSQLVDCSSGIHPRFAKYYIRNVRVSVSSPIYAVLKYFNVPMSPENGQNEDNMITAVVHFPVKAPDKAKLRSDFDAIQMLNFWKLNKIYYTEHNPSVTVSYKPDEEINILNWVWEYRTIIGGITFLPYSDAKYNNMPYVEITEEEYIKLIEEFPIIDWSLIEEFEKEDQTKAAQELACMAGSCELF